MRGTLHIRDSNEIESTSSNGVQKIFEKKIPLPPLWHINNFALTYYLYELELLVEKLDLYVTISSRSDEATNASKLYLLLLCL